MFLLLKSKIWYLTTLKEPQKIIVRKYVAIFLFNERFNVY
ncbi:hypothetical protein SAMN05216269_10880 [Flavobacterium xinjiangense]|uniref:Uncharacterized protein n=1 Tax=Flavobacterium xinjiangense TaxID=178356 RepID=A0A1M7MD86_9FLAO|nr:hypothetical protein SAMN05216269_10880 [Flavobacterium xinjiangense]